MRTLFNDEGRVYLYGTGERGHAAMLYIEKYYRKIDAFVVSDKSYLHESKKNIYGCPIYCINEILPPPKPKDVCILATALLPEVIPLAHKKEWDIETLTEREWNIAYGLLRLASENIDINAELLDFGSFKIPNLYNKIDSLALIDSLTLELGDLVLPYMGNNNYIGEGCYEYDNVRLKEGDYVIDCGSNVGLFSAKAAYSGCNVYAIEPLAQCVECIERINTLCKKNITIIQKAVGKETGKVEFIETEFNIGASSMVMGRTGTKHLIDMTTIDELVSDLKLPRVDFIKADIEGAERFRLEGATHTLKKYAPKLSICTYHLYDDVEVLTDLIKAANPNYKIKYAWEKLYAYVPK